MDKKEIINPLGMWVLAIFSISTGIYIENVFLKFMLLLGGVLLIPNIFDSYKKEINSYKKLDLWNVLSIIFLLTAIFSLTTYDGLTIDIQNIDYLISVISSIFFILISAFFIHIKKN